MWTRDCWAAWWRKNAAASSLFLERFIGYNLCISYWLHTLWLLLVQLFASHRFMIRWPIWHLAESPDFPSSKSMMVWPWAHPLMPCEHQLGLQGGYHFPLWIPLRRTSRLLGPSSWLSLTFHIVRSNSPCIKSNFMCPSHWLWRGFHLRKSSQGKLGAPNTARESFGAWMCLPPGRGASRN